VLDKDGNKNGRRQRRGPGDASGGDGASERTNNHDSDLHETASTWATSPLAQALFYLLLRDDGWLRAVPQENGKTIFLKWKFTNGKFAGKYVMYVITDGDLPAGFAGLFDKIARAYQGTHTPTPDTPWS